MALATNEYWSMSDKAFYCLIDHDRTEAFAKVIAGTVKPGDIVVDLGTGTGVLAMMAARAGAAKVYAIELDPYNIATLSRVFRENGFSDRIVLLEGDARSLDLPQKINVVIAEMIATGLIEEMQVPAMNNILRFTDENTKIILQNYKTYIDLVYQKTQYYGFKFNIFRYQYPDMPELNPQICSERYLVDDADFGGKRASFDVNVALRVVAIKGGMINGLRITGDTMFCDGSTLGGTYAYSYPVIVPIEERRVQPGDEIILDLSYTVSGGMSSFKYVIK